MTPNLSHVAGLELAKKAMEQQRERYGGVHKASLACLDGLIEIAKSAPAEPDADLVRQCIAQELATWEGDFKGPVHTAMRCLQVRIDAKLASLKGVEE